MFGTPFRVFLCAFCQGCNLWKNSKPNHGNATSISLPGQVFSASSCPLMVRAFTNKCFCRAGTEMNFFHMTFPSAECCHLSSHLCNLPACLIALRLYSDLIQGPWWLFRWSSTTNPPWGRSFQKCRGIYCSVFILTALSTVTCQVGFIRAPELGCGGFCTRHQGQLRSSDQTQMHNYTLVQSSFLSIKSCSRLAEEFRWLTQGHSGWQVRHWALSMSSPTQDEILWQSELILPLPETVWTFPEAQPDFSHWATFKGKIKHTMLCLSF